MATTMEYKNLTQEVPKQTKFYLNCAIIIKAAAIGIWFYGINRILHKYFPEPTWFQIMIMFALSMSILLYEDGYLSELHDLKSATISAISGVTHENFQMNLLKK